jgi:hypothetical protein
MAAHDTGREAHIAHACTAVKTDDLDALVGSTLRLANRFATAATTLDSGSLARDALACLGLAAWLGRVADELLAREAERAARMRDAAQKEEKGGV